MKRCLVIYWMNLQVSRGIKLNHPKVSATKLDLKSVLDKTNMQEALGKENYSNF